METTTENIVLGLGNHHADYLTKIKHFYSDRSDDLAHVIVVDSKDDDEFAVITSGERNLISIRIFSGDKSNGRVKPNFSIVEFTADGKIVVDRIGDDTVNSRGSKIKIYAEYDPGENTFTHKQVLPHGVESSEAANMLNRHRYPNIKTPELEKKYRESIVKAQNYLSQWVKNN